MRIEQASVFKFFLSYEGTELMIPLAAPDETTAKIKLRELMLKWANELSQPVLSPFSENKAPPAPERPFSPVVLELRIEELIKELVPIKKPKGAQTIDRLVKEWTGFQYDASNYPAIISELEKIKNARID